MPQQIVHHALRSGVADNFPYNLSMQAFPLTTSRQTFARPTTLTLLAHDLKTTSGIIRRK